MASISFSDMLSRRLFLRALKSISSPQASVNNGPQLTLAEAAGLSTYDKPAAPTLEENAFYDKYKEKLAKLKSSKPAEYESAMGNVYGKENKSSANFTSATNAGASDIKGSAVLDKMKASSQENKTNKPEENKKKRPGLDSILKLDMIQDLPPSEITAVWNQYLSNKDGIIFASIPAEKYNRLKVKAMECPLFLYALPRDSGFEFMLGQYSDGDWYYTPLITYQTHGEYASYSLAVYHYTELSESKGLVLMKGEIASDDLRPELATLLVHQTQLMYGSDENFTLVEKMNHKPDEFKHMDVLELYKKVGMF